MRPLYFFLKILLKITLWIYYPRFMVVNRPKKRFARTIYMSNHASSFMDPLVVASGQKPIVFFMTRADIYKGWLKTVFWLAHMIPIFREQDGGDTRKQNEEIMKTSNAVLKYGRSLLIFAEGFTDDVFVRRLKPIKKGGIRMGFTALESIDWTKKIYIQAVGVNYSDPNNIGSDCIISNGKTICLNDFRKDYEENPNKTVNQLKVIIEKDMQNQLVDVRNKNMTSFHENIMRLTRKGMNDIDSDKSIPLLERWKYAKNLANWFNQTKIEENEELISLKEDLENYFNSLEKSSIEEGVLYKIITNQRSKIKDFISLTLLFPFMILGAILNYLPYRLIKNFIEKTFKRRVFWSSVKMLVGAGAVGIYNFLFLLIISKIFGISFVFLLLLGLIITPISFVIYRKWHKILSDHKKMNFVANKDYSEIVQQREAVINKIHQLVPIA